MVGLWTEGRPRGPIWVGPAITWVRGRSHGMTDELGHVRGGQEAPTQPGGEPVQGGSRRRPAGTDHPQNLVFA